MTSDASYLKELATEREMKDKFMAHHVESPFIAERIGGFEGLRYFPPDRRYRVNATLDRRDPPPEAYLRTNRDGQAVMRWIGDLIFELEKKRLHLRVYHAGEGVGTSVFVPFRDLTSGSESYGPGRYVTFELNAEDVYEIDFNRAFNPYCAYTDAYECGFPPSENDLPVAIRAGEKVWTQDRNPSSPSGAVRELLDRVAPRKISKRVVRGPVPPRARPRSRPKAKRS